MERRKEMCSLKSNEPGAGIVLMKLDEIHRFEGHPFKVERNQELIDQMLKNYLRQQGKICRDIHGVIHRKEIIAN